MHLRVIWVDLRICIYVDGFCAIYGEFDGFDVISWVSMDFGGYEYDFDRCSY